MSRTGSYVLTLSLLVLSALMIYLNVKQNLSFAGISSEYLPMHIVHLNTPLLQNVEGGNNALKNFKPHRSPHSRHSSPASIGEAIHTIGAPPPLLSPNFGYPQVTLSATPSGVSNFQIFRQESRNQWMRNANNASMNIMPLSGSRSSSRRTANQGLAFMSGSSLNPKLSEESLLLSNQNLMANNSNNPSGLLIDPGGDPDPGEMISIPDGLLYLLLLSLVYMLMRWILRVDR